MDHDHGVFGHADRVAGHQDHAAHRRGQTIHKPLDTRWMRLEQVVHGHAFKHVTAGGVDVQIDLGHVTEGFQVASKLVGRNAPGTNVTVKHQVHDAPGLGSQRVPALPGATCRPPRGHRHPVFFPFHSLCFSRSTGGRHRS